MVTDYNNDFLPVFKFVELIFIYSSVCCLIKPIILFFLRMFSHHHVFSRTLKFLIRVLHFLFFFEIFSYLHGLIRTYTFIYFREKFSPTRLLGTTCLFIFGAYSQLQDYSLGIYMKEKEKETTLGFKVVSM